MLSGTFVYDIECYKNLFWVVLKDINGKKDDYLQYGLEEGLVSDVIRNPDITLIGWNNHAYDDLLLDHIARNWGSASGTNWRAQVNEITERNLFELSTKIIRQGVDNEYVKELRWADKTFNSIDVKALLDPLPGLKKIEMRIGFRKVQDLPVAFDQELTDEQKEIVKIYCCNDVDATETVYRDHGVQHIELRDFLSNKFRLDQRIMRSASEPRTAETILSRQATQFSSRKPWAIKEYLAALDAAEGDQRCVHLSSCIPPWIHFHQKDLVALLAELQTLELPIKATGYTDGSKLKRVVQIGNKSYQLGIGGLHSIDEAGTWHASPKDGWSLIDADVTSYYPSILLRDQLHPRGYDIQWIFAYDSIYQERLQAKQDPARTTESHALKIILNSSFGKFGSRFSSFYDPTLMVRVTLTGQLALLMLIESTNEQGIEVLSANTDGILIRLHDSQQEKWEQVCQDWEKVTRFQLETQHYRRYARRDVNSYTATTMANSVKNKGIFAPPDIRHDVQAPIIQTMARHFLLWDIDPEDTLSDLMSSGNMQIQDFVFHFGATSAFQIYLKDHCGTDKEEWIPLSKSNRWYIGPSSIDNQLVKHGGKRDNTISIPNGRNIVLCNEIIDDPVGLPSDLNQDYYIEKAWGLIKSCQGTDT